MLRLTDVQVRYTGGVLALDGLSLEVPEGHIVALLGANGAGKSTALKSISGLLRGDGGRVTAGSIELDGRSLTRLDTADIVRLGVFHVMEGRRVFAHLSVEDNLRAGAYSHRAGLKENLAHVYACFPRLRERRHAPAGYLSGGEQQMLAIGRALMASPRLVLLDEPSLGLAPSIVADIFEILQRLNRELKTSFLMVEQNAHAALRVATSGYVVAGGRVVLHGDAARLRADRAVQDIYFGQKARP